MKIVVTGGTSTVGKHLKQLLPDALFLSSKDCDLTSYTCVHNLFKSTKPDIVIHLAALVGGIKDNVSRPVEYLEQNLLINTNTIRASFEAGVRKLIALSSTCIYPDTVSSYPMTESDMFLGPPPPTNFSYAYSKRCMIAQIDAYNKQHNTQFCYITPSNLYSELDTHERDRAHFITALLAKIRQQEAIGGKTISLLGTGKPLRQFTYAGDIASILYLMVKKGIYESFNVSNPETYTVDQLARITLNALGKRDWEIEYQNPEMDGQYRKDVSIEKMMQHLPNFEFTKFAEGVKKSYIG